MDEIIRRRLELASGMGDKQTRDAIASALIDHGGGLIDTWTTLAYQEEPEDLVGKIVWYAGILSQLLISVFTFPAALGAFLLEEAAQSLGMGSYLLYTAKDWTDYFPYQQMLLTTIDGYTTTAKALATVNPITAGAAVIYLDAAKVSALASQSAATYQIFSDARKLGITVTDSMSSIEVIGLINKYYSDKAAADVQEENMFGTLAIKSTPTYADIYLDGAATGLQTPETFKQMSPGNHEVAVGRFNTKTQEYDTYATTIQIIAGRKKEITLHITTGTSDDLVNPGGEDEDETPQLPPFIKTTVTAAKMIDGDTFETIAGERIRILGMDAPETGQPIADLSKTFMDSKLVDHKVDVKIQTHLPVDTYGRTLAIVTYRDENVAVSSIAAGLARAYVLSDATYDPTRYLEAEQIAKTRKIGIWNPSTPGITWRG